jgi:hypothetical protein
MEIDGPAGSDRHLLRISFVLEEAFRATTDDFVEN